MRKLRLDVDELRVETFATETGKSGIGTVWANMPVERPAPGESDSDPNSGFETCPCTLRWSCTGCGICTVVDCSTWATDPCPSQPTYCC